jgi:hypothetical protein
LVLELNKLGLSFGNGANSISTPEIYYANLYHHYFKKIIIRYKC